MSNMQAERIKIDYGKTLGQLTKEELIQLIYDLFEKGEWNSWKIEK